MAEAKAFADDPEQWVDAHAGKSPWRALLTALRTENRRNFETP